MFSCLKCDTSFTNYGELNDHNREVHSSEPFECPICSRRIQLAHNMSLHLQQCEKRKQPTCSICRKKYSNNEILREHTRKTHTYGLLKRCRLCGAKFITNSELDDHIYASHIDSTKEVLPKADPVEFDQASVVVEEPLKQIFRRYWSVIRTFYKFDPLVNTYNFRVTSYDNNSTLTNLVTLVYQHQNGIFKLNIAFGLILQHKPTGVFRYYHVGKNSDLFEEPKRIASRKDLHDLIEELNTIDPYQHGAMARPDTTHTVFAITNVTLKTVQCQDSIPIGGKTYSDDTDMQIFLRNCNYITWMEKDKNGRSFNDNLCFFRCLSSQMVDMNYPPVKDVRELFEKWVAHQEHRGITVNRNTKTFRGVTMMELPDLEDCFQYNINVYTLTDARDKNGAPMARTLFRSAKLFQRYLFLNYFQNHFSRITSINHYARTWLCAECDSIMDTQRQYALHIRKCQGKVRKIFPGGGFALPRTVFDKLSDEGFTIDDRFYPYYIVYDFECMFHSAGDTQTFEQKLVYEKQLVPVSVSICSNVPGFLAPKCFILNNPQQLIDTFLDYVCQIAETAHQTLNDKFVYIAECISEQIENLSSGRANRSGVQGTDKAISHWETIGREWDAWITRIPVVGFNSSRFDVNLIRRFFIPSLIRKLGDIDSCITKGSAYVTLTAHNLLFLDISNFLAAGISYSKWIEGFDVEQAKGLFPYEWLTSFDRLYQTHLPPPEAFYSRLNQTSISESDYNHLKSVWIDNRFKNMFDFLRWYNNLDVVPFIAALEKIRKFFMTMDIDLLKEGCVSLPGLAMTHMFKSMSADAIFQLYDSSTKNYHDLVWSNIVGGPSIIFNRCTVTGCGQIKKIGPVPATIEGYDCNGLYLSALKELMPTGFAAIWEMKGTDTAKTIPTSTGNQTDSEISALICENMLKVFNKKQTGSGFDEILCVCFVHHQLQKQNNNKRLSLQHMWNGGQKVFHIKGSQLPVDGWIPELNLVIQYNGCFFHGLRCSLTEQCSPKELLKREAHTKRICDLLISEGHNLFCITECEFECQKLVSKTLRKYMGRIRLRSMHGPKMKAQEMLELVVSDRFFGMIELDIQVPFWKPELREAMKEFPPIFKNVEVTIDDVGVTMADYARKNGFLKKPRRCLISSYYGTKILLPTPLIKWYLETGLIVSRIYRAIEYAPRRTFSHLVEEVTNHRRASDKDKRFRCYGETFKLLGNSYYGKCLTNLEKHRKIQFGDRHDASRAINSSRFRSLEPIGSGLYEIQSAKNTLCFKLPINIGYFVYGYAKLRMLQFYYDFLCKVLPFHHFELIEMDTDSLYFSLAGNTLVDTVTSETSAAYERLKRDFLAIDEADKRTTGLFKLEWAGKIMMCTASKSYIAYTPVKQSDGSTKLTNVKLSSKGVSKKTNNLMPSDFESSIFDEQTVEGVNRGFRMKEGDLFQYTQRRRALLFLYIKRIVKEDKIHTYPLEL